MAEKNSTTPLSTKAQNKAEGTATYIKGKKPLRESDNNSKETDKSSVRKR